MEYQKLLGKQVVLLPLQEEYIEQYLVMFSPKVRYALHVTNTESERDYLRNSLVEMHTGKTVFYVITDILDNQLIGAIAIRDSQIYKGQLYSWLNETYWGSGRYQEALTLITDYYFQLTKALYITAHVDITNVRSHRALKKHGWADAGISQGPYGKQYELIVRNKINR